jgi:hypothetical protein
MPLIGGGGGGSGTPGGSGLPPSIGINNGSRNQDQVNAGKISVGLSNPAGTIIQSAGNVAALGTGLTKAVVQGIEGLPVVGPLVAQPVIGAVGGAVDATIGKVVPKKLDMTGVEEFANAPMHGALELLTGPSQAIQEAVLRAKIQNVVENKFDLVSLVSAIIPGGTLPDSVQRNVIDQYRRGATIEEIASSWVDKFGSPQGEEYGAFSSNGIVNFLFSAITDPLNIIPVGKPFQLAARASNIAKAGGVETLRAGLVAAERRLTELVASGADNAVVEAQKQVIKDAGKQIVFFERWELPGQMWSKTFGRMGDVKNKFFAGPLANNMLQAWSRTVSAKGGTWALDRLGTIIGESEVKAGVGDLVLTTANAAKSEMVQIATHAFRARWDEASANILKKLHTLVSEGSTIEKALDSEWRKGTTIRQVLTEAKIPRKEFDDLVKLFGEDGVPEYITFVRREEVTSLQRRLGSSLSNSAVSKDPQFLLKVGEAQGGSNLAFATDAAVDVLSRDKSTLIRYAQDEVLGVDYLSRSMQFGWGLTKEAADKYARDAFAELGKGSRELLDVIDLARMKSYGKLVRESALARSAYPKTFGELPETILRRGQIAKSFFPDLDPKEAADSASILDHIARTGARNQGITIEEWYLKSTFGIEGVSTLDDAVAITETLNKAVTSAKIQFKNATPEEVLAVAERIQPTARMLQAAEESGVATLSKKSKIETITFPGAEKPFAIPGGMAGLDDPAPFGLIDEVIIQAQGGAEFIPGATRVKIYKKIWASKGIDLQNNIEVTNRVVFGLLSANTGLTPNAALYTLLRVQTPEGLALFSDTWGALVRSGESASALGRKFKLELPGAKEFDIVVKGKPSKAIRFPTDVPGEYRGIEISNENIGRVIKTLVFASENPGWFRLAPGETLESLAERLTFISGSGVKVGTFAVELMSPGQMSRGAIDRQMSAYIFEYAIKDLRKGGKELDALVNDIFNSGNTPADTFDYLDSMLKAVLDDGEEYILPNGKKIIGDRTEQAAAAAKQGTTIGVSAPHIKARRGIKGWNKDISPTSAALYDAMPGYVLGKEPIAGFYEGSIANVMNNWIEKISKTLYKEYPGLEDLSGAQKQWFLWDLQRGNIEPHSWINKGVDVMEKPSIEMLTKALKEITGAGGQKQGAFKGVNPETLAEFFQKRGEDVLGSTSFDKDGRAIIKLFKGSNVETALHEIGHVARRQLTPEDNALVLDIYGVKNGKWDVVAEERFADDFTKYLYTGEAPIRDLEDVFYRMRAWLSKLWGGMTGAPIKTEIDPKMKEVFDRLFITNDENVTKPTLDFYSRATIISNRTFTQAARRDLLDRVDALNGKSDGGKKVSVEEAVDTVPDYVKKYVFTEGGGATYNPIRKTAKVVEKDRGFSVGSYPGLAAKYSGAERQRLFSDQAFLAEQVRQFVKKNAKLLERDGLYVGLYDSPETGTAYIDISRVYNTAEEAIDTATSLGEESIFSFFNGGTYYMDTAKGVAAAALKKVKTVKSPSEISGLKKLEVRTVPKGKALEELEKMAKDVVNNYDEAGAEFFGKPHTWDQVIDWVRQHPEVAAREMNQVELENLPKELQAILDHLGSTNLYKFGVAPENGVIKRLSWVSDQYGSRYLTRQASPFVDSLDHVQVSAIDKKIAAGRVIPNSFDRLADKFRPYGPEVIRNGYIQRFIAKTTPKGVSVREAEQIMLKVSNLSYKKETSIQGLWFESTDIEQIYKDVLGRTRFEEYIVKNDPVKDVMEAAAGDLSSVGLTTGFTGRAKAWRPIIGVVTNRLYPLFRFGKGNPIFQRILEPIETRIMKLVDDIKLEYKREWLEATDSEVLRKMFLDNRSVNTEIADGLYHNREAMTNATVAANKEAEGFVAHVNSTVQKYTRGAKWNMVNPLEYKRISRDATGGQLATRSWYGAMSKYAPEYMPDMAEHYGITNSNDLVTALLEDIMVASNPAVLEARLGAEAAKTVGLYEKTLLGAGLEPSRAREIAAVAYGVWSDSLVRATRIADKMQYFSPMRSWFERSINHPFLGIYPYSYMTQKAIPAVLNLMFAPKIGGWVHPGMGYVNYMRFREMVVQNAEGNEDFISQVIRSPELGWVLNIAIPAMPESLGYSAPGWIRRAIVRPALQGRGAQLSQVPEEFAKTLAGGTVAGQAASIGEAYASINKPLSEDIKSFRETIAEGLQRNLVNKP